MRSLRRLVPIVLVLALAMLGGQRAGAQPFDNILGGPLGPGGDAGPDSPEAVVQLFANFTAPGEGRPGMLSVTAKIAPPWYTYSTTQKPVQATPTVLSVEPSDQFKLAGDFRSTLPPKIVKDGSVTLEEHAGEVTWQAPIDFQAGVTVNDLVIKGKARIQVCKAGTCLPPTEFPFEAAFLETPTEPESRGEFKSPAIHATLKGQIEPKVVAPGGTASLVITAEMPAGWHIYELEPKDPKRLGSKPTLIALSNTSGFGAKRTTASGKLQEAPAVVAGQPKTQYYNNRVVWTTPIVIPKDAKPGQYPIDGIVGYQTCFTDARCDLPQGAKFSGTIEVAAKEQPGQSLLTFRDGAYAEAALVAAKQPPPIDTAVAGGPAGLTLPLVILFGLLGGFILNFMPCVLPVIGLKILSFAEQAGRSRAQILALNVWYSLGTLAVFMALATLAAWFSLGWGEQFTSTTFNIVMVAIVFVMALSFLGVWEIPIPGFVGSGKTGELAAREGVAGAFSKGVLATLLATPCSGPALGPVFGFTLSQPAWVTYLLFGCIALGMSAPYLLIGAFPTLIRFLPKPGAWMETFKNLMGFVLLGTIAFLFSFMNRDYFVATFTMMVGLWAACWWIGRTPLTAELGRKLMAWAQGAVVAGVVALFAFSYLTPRESIIPWKPFSRTEVARLNQAGNTVLVDFTADWCLTCKYNLKTAVETADVRDALAANKIVPLLADWTDGSSEIKDALASLNSKSIPVLAIYPADRPNEPIVLRDVITQQQVLEAIQSAAAAPAKNGKKLTAALP